MNINNDNNKQLLNTLVLQLTLANCEERTVKATNSIAYWTGYIHATKDAIGHTEACKANLPLSPTAKRYLEGYRVDSRGRRVKLPNGTYAR